MEHLETQTRSELSDLPRLSIHLAGNSDKRHQFSFKQRRKISGFLWNILDISRIYPSHANSERKKVLTLLQPQAKLEEWLEEQHRQGAAVQPYPVIT